MFLEALAASCDASHAILQDTDYEIDADRPSWQLFALLLATARGPAN